ncbi:hypothetical protein Riv7116_4220 [Rivularia sp. PCC 7116]|uniref:DUF6745 domain-containing protein n=1 Tax=Rivularia sp. PCC 7116 TaxID=373994 RepID=UPI00029F0AAB|nr:hypothetical protein [Rivularia sp. PCC 7116]AFY56651.1 hypothetical protein Riv7116_4220 [Rivularia sp. PCC 7116]
MNQEQIKKKLLAYAYVEKWRKILFNTEPINQKRVEELIKKSYQILDLAEPQIIFCQSPLEAHKYLSEIQPSISDYIHLKGDLSSLLGIKLLLKIRCYHAIYPKISTMLFFEAETFLNVTTRIYEVLEDCLESQHLWKMIDSELMASSLYDNDFYIEGLNCGCNQEVWNILKPLAEECPYILSFKDFCIVINRPIELHLDKTNCLHAEAKPAVIFADGFNIYSYHGTIIPEKYGKFQYSQWQPQWLLEESDEDLRMVLIRGIGYERLEQELPEYNCNNWEDCKTLISDILNNLYLYFSLNCLVKSYSHASNQTYEKYQKLTKTRPIQVPQEVSEISDFRGIQIAPNLIIRCFKDTVRELYCPEWMQENYITPDNCAIPIFYGIHKELYYFFGYEEEFSQEEKEFSEIWYVSEKSEPQICASSLTSLLLTIIECYQTGAYYPVINEQTGTTYLLQDKSKLENIFRKFNPDYLDVWQEICNKA